MEAVRALSSGSSNVGVRGEVTAMVVVPLRTKRFSRILFSAAETSDDVHVEETT
jgi:hypothetical protein